MASRRFSWVWTIPVMVSIVGGTSIAAPLLKLAEVAQTVESRRGEALRLNGEGWELAQQGKSIEALEKYQQALAIVREIQERQGEGVVLNNIGGAYNNLGQYDKALEFSQQALAIRREVRDRPGEGTTLNAIGWIYRNLRQYDKALEFLQQALIIRKEVTDRSGEGITLNNIGEVYRNLGQYDKALEYYQQVLEIAKEVGDRTREGMTLNNIGEVYGSNLGQYDKALEFLQQALAIVKEVRDRPGESTTLNNIGAVYVDLGQYDKSLEYYQQALTIVKEVKNRPKEGTTLNNIGAVYIELGQYDKALEYYQQALAIAKEVRDHLGEGTTLNNIGRVYIELGQYDKGLECFRQALAIVKEVKNRPGEITALSNIGGAYISLKQYDKGLEYYQQALAIGKEIRDRAREGTILNAIGGTYIGLGQYDKALEFLQQALAIHKEIRALSGEGTTLNNIGWAYSGLGQYDKALEFLQQALTIHKEIRDRLGEGITLENIGNILLLTGKLKEADSLLFEAIKIWESLRAGLVDQDKVSLFETQRLSYRGLQAALVAQSRHEDALEISERGRTRALVELLSSRIKASDSIRSSSVNESAPNKSPSLNQMKQIAQQQNLTLVEFSFASARFETNGKQQWGAVLFTWVIQPDGQITFRQIDLENLQTPLKDLVSISRDAIGVRSRIDRSLVAVPVSNPEQQKQALQQLHKILIEPIADLLPKDPNQRVAFMPQDSLFLVPFAALQDKDGKYLVEKHTIVTAPSIQTLQLTRETRLKQKSQTDEALIVGNPIMPTFNETQLSDLPGAKQEAIAISKLFSTQPLIGAQATKAEVVKRMKTAKYIHLATHGLLDSIKGDIPGAIALTSDANNNGFLTAGEIFEMQLNADLVVLSACDTARGDIKGEGVIGLSRSLISAGVPSIIVSLWQVPDSPTASLMTEFYRNLREKKLDKAQSLRQAMLTTMKQHPNPRDWAAFTLIGESE